MVFEFMILLSSPEKELFYRSLFAILSNYYVKGTLVLEVLTPFIYTPTINNDLHLKNHKKTMMDNINNIPYGHKVFNLFAL